MSVSAGAAHAATPPLESYEVQVKGSDLEDLALAGFDVTEGRVGNTLTVVASPAEVGTLRKLGFTPKRSTNAARVAPDYGPAGGYDVWRPYARAAFDLSGDPTDNLLTEMQKLAAANPGIVKLVKIGQTGGAPDDPETTEDDDYTQPKPIYAVKVSRDARSEPDGSKPAVIYSSTQHAREWLSTETNRRLMKLFIDNYGETGTAVGTDGAPVAGVQSEELTELVDTRELWFLIVANPDGYDYTFESPETRLWRKNLRDNDGDGKLTGLDGVDPNRNFPTNWGYDDEGSASAISDQTYRGPAPGSEPETKAFDSLMARTNAEFNNNFHTFGQLLLYPFGFQVNTYAADDPLFRALSGSDENPAIPGFNPGVGAELYVTNGDTNDHAYQAYDILSWTPELKGGDPAKETGAGGFIFQDVEADIQAEFEDQLQFSLDMARNAPDPGNSVSHTGRAAPDFEVDSFEVSYGDPQTVQVKAKRSLGAVTANWQIGQGPTQSAPAIEWEGGERYGGPGDVYYHRVRAQVTGAKPGQKVKVWFTAAGRKSEAFTYTLESDSGAPVIVIADENYSGPVPAYTDTTKPKYLAEYTAALDALGVKYDVWDVDARQLTAPDPLGVLSHYRGMIWYTGDNSVTRAPGQPGQTGALKVANDLTVAVRDRLNEGGKLLLTGQESGFQYFDAYEYAQFGEPVDTPTGYCAAPTDVADSCIPLSNDFFQYYLGGFIYAAGGGSDGENAFPVQGLGEFGDLKWSFEPDSQPFAGTALVTSSLLPKDRYPQFASEGLAEFQRPGAAPYDPFAGDWYLYSGQSDLAYRRLATTVDLTGKTGGKLDFQTSFDIEPDYDFMFVEAHTPGQDDWTTLPITDDEGTVLTDTDEDSTLSDTGLSCGGDGYTWHDDHPFLAHYQTFTDVEVQCEPTGTTGEWNALTGNSSGWQHLNVDLSDYDGKKVEVSITYVQDGAVQGLGVFLDEVRLSAGSTVLSTAGFEKDLAPWTVPGPPEGTEFNVTDWSREQAAFDEAPVIGTEDTVWMTFGLEAVDTEANRNALLGRTLTRFGILQATPTPTPTAAPTESPTATPTATPTPGPPARQGRVRIGPGPVRAKRNRTVRIGVKCVDPAGTRCTGAISLGHKGKQAGSAVFTAKAEVKKQVKVTLKRGVFRTLVRKGVLDFKAAASATSGGYRLLRGRAVVQVRAPR